MRRDSFDDDNQNFLASILKRDGLEPMPQSMARLLVIVGVVAVLAAMIAIGVAIWPHGKGGATNLEDLPVVHADKAEIRVKPEDRGGMEVPNRNSTIFENIADGDGEKKVENLFEDEEQPIDKDEVLADEAPPEEIKPEAVVEDAEVKGEEVNVVTTNKVEEVEENPEAKAEPAPVLKAEEKAAAKPKETEKTDIISALKEEVGTADNVKPAAGSKYIQLASVKSEAEAKTKWAKLQAQFPSLKGTELRVQRADLGAKGVFFRVQAGPMAAEDAQKICNGIKSSKGDCLLVK